ncbi:MAG TPA: efflux RND transporter periplasmic adaptor subunit [Holophagaceae bacterium]|jgi:HlyD family secretion protein|nr:efflux RND transporter periplasmic adaptor subunit [Holophagaceae bacterium]
MKRKKLWFIAGGVGLLIVVSIAATRNSEKGAGVQAAQVKRERLISKVSANGTIQAVTKADISANVMGQVTKLAVKEGDRVKKGQFLLEIDPTRARADVAGASAGAQASQADYATAQARLAQAKVDFERAQANFKAGILSKADYDQSQTALLTARSGEAGARQRADQARAQVRSSKVNLDYAILTAPMDGVVTARRIQVGETAVPGIQNSPGTVLVTVSDMSKVEAEMQVDEASIPNVKVGQQAVVHIDAYPGQPFDAQVTEVGGSPIVQTATNEAIKFKVKVWIKNPPLTIKPGLSAQADIYTGEKDDALAVPIQALVMRDIPLKPGQTLAPGQPREEEGVYAIDGGKVKFMKVKTGLMGDLDVEVAEGLKGGEQIVQGPYRALRELKDGAEVHIQKDAPKGPDGNGPKS